MSGAEFHGLKVVDWSIGAFDAQIAWAQLYDTKDTPRVPIGSIYVEHRAYAHAADLLEHRIYEDDQRLARLKLGVFAVREETENAGIKR